MLIHLECIRQSTCALVANISLLTQPAGQAVLRERFSDALNKIGNLL